MNRAPATSTEYRPGRLNSHAGQSRWLEAWCHLGSVEMPSTAFPPGDRRRMYLLRTVLETFKRAIENRQS
jgi:hypothetical protein